MTSFIVATSVVLLWLCTTAYGDAPYDAEVCVPSIPVVPLPVPAAALGQVWEAEIEWKDDVQNRTYIVRDYRDGPNNREKLVISMPLRDDVTVLYDWNTQDVIVQENIQVTPTESRLHCQFVEHKNFGGTFTYSDRFFLASFSKLMDKFVDSKDAVNVGKTTVRGVKVSNWTACVYDYFTNITARTNLYFSDPTWLSPYLPPTSVVPVRLEFVGRKHNGSSYTDINLTGDLVSLKKRGPDKPFPTGTFSTQDGAFCPNRTGTFMRFPIFPTHLSMLSEIIDIDFKRISYEELWYDQDLQMVRMDSKQALGEDSDPSSYIFDFKSGVKYMIDKYTMTCTPSPIVYGDDFTVQANGTVAMMSTAAIFRAEGASIQYVGRVSVRNVECDTWIGHYFDRDANRETTVQWYFTVHSWTEATGTVEGGGAFFMMKVWKGGSGNPEIHNVMRYSPTAPDFNAFDISACYDSTAKKHFTIEFLASDINRLKQISRPYLKTSVVKELTGRLQIEMNRFTDVTMDLDQTSNSIFLSSTLLGPPIFASPSKHEIPLAGAFSFLQGSIDASHLAFNITMDGSFVTLTGISLVEHNFRKEFSTTTSTLPPTTKIVAPTLVPPKRPSTTQPPLPTIPPSTKQPTAPCQCPKTTCPPEKTCPPEQTCPPSQNCPVCSTVTSPPPCSSVCPPRRSCPTPAPCSCPGGVVDVTCPTPKPCPKSTSSVCQCPTTPSCGGNQALSGGGSSGGISSGALAGGILAALVVGLALGIIATRFYHVTRVNNNQMTINLIEDNI